MMDVLHGQGDTIGDTMVTHSHIMAGEERIETGINWVSLTMAHTSDWTDSYHNTIISTILYIDEYP